MDKRVPLRVRQSKFIEYRDIGKWNDNKRKVNSSLLHFAAMCVLHPLLLSQALHRLFRPSPSLGLHPPSAPSLVSGKWRSTWRMWVQHTEVPDIISHCVLSHVVGARSCRNLCPTPTCAAMDHCSVFWKCGKPAAGSLNCSATVFQHKALHLTVRSLYRRYLKHSSLFQSLKSYRYVSLGLQLQRGKDGIRSGTVEDVLESALHAAGAISDANFGELSKVSWSRASRTDKGMYKHSLEYLKAEC